MFGASVRDLVLVVVTGGALYATTFVLVRVAGRRTVSQLSAFDALITIAVGSVFATTIVSDPPSYGRGAAAVVTLLLLQVVVGLLRQRHPRLRRYLDFSPETVFEHGRMQAGRNPLGPQLTADELDAAIRAA
ncbi:MAG: hypothetical protein AB7V15_01650, partial [Acidimicrobiia bacterium]